MITAWKERIKKKKLNNNGSAIILVILALAFVGMLIAMLVYMVYYNYLMKHTDRAAKDNFYTAETALNEVRAGIVRDTSDALMEAYNNVIRNHADESSINQQAYFETEFEKTLKSNLQMQELILPSVGVSRLVYSKAALTNYFVETPKVDPNSANPLYGAKIDYAGNVSGVSGDNGAGNYTDGNLMILEDVKVTFTDENGYVSIIVTDIAIETPEISFSSILDIPQIENYSLVAADCVTTGVGVEMDDRESAARVQIDGNVYGGEDGIYVVNDGQMHFTQNAADADTVKYTVTAGNICAKNGHRNTNASPTIPSILIDEAFTTWANDIYIESSYINLASDCFVQDDLTLDGKYAKVKLSGSYQGYGAEDATASNSSSMVINGAFSNLDFSELKGLWLAGSAYVGATHYNANELTDDYIDGDLDEYYEKVDEEIADGIRDEETISHNSADVRLGQSLAVKSDQIMYMVPVECMGYKGDMQVLAKNPMTIDEYNKLVDTFEPELDTNGNTIINNGEIQYSATPVYTPVRLDVVMNKVGGTPNSYGASFTHVFRRVNGDILVYYYLDFASQELANKFFRDYYDADKAAFDRYFKTYINSFKLNDSLTNGSATYPLNIAGNLLYQRNNQVYMKEDTLDEDFGNIDAMYENSDKYTLQFTSLSKFLMQSTSGLSAKQLKNNVFDNVVVDEDTFSELVPKGKYKEYKNDAGDLRAFLVNYNVEEFKAFEIDDTIAKDCAIVIARGDVNVSAQNFSGLILCGGRISIKSSCNKISYDANSVRKALTLSVDDRYVFEAIVNGVAYANIIGGTDEALENAVLDTLEKDVVTADKLVKYQNWSKQ